MIPEIKNFLLINWKKIVPDYPVPSDISFLGIPGAGEGGTVTFLLFIDSKNYPLFAIKVYRDNYFPNRAKTEAVILKRLESIPIIAPNVPRLIYKSLFGKNRILIQSILDGQAMTITIAKYNLPPNKIVKHHFELVTNWLIELGQQTRHYNLNENYFYSIINNAKRIFKFSEKEQFFLIEIENNLKNIVSYGSVIEHGDFCRQNILLMDDINNPKINIIDWSDSKIDGIPISDLLIFLTTYLLKLRKKTGVAGLIETFELTFFQSNPFSTNVWKAINSYIKNFKILKSDLPFLLGVIFLNQACYEYSKLKYASLQGTLPGFTLSLVESENDSVEDAIKRIPWYYFFQSLVKQYNKDFFFSKNKNA
jgi:hypothetical protein